jgi:hypothetical protein
MNSSSPGLHPGHYLKHASTTDGMHILTDSRVRNLERRLAWARWAHVQMPLTLLYGPQPLRLVGLERYLAEGRWAA